MACNLIEDILQYFDGEINEEYEINKVLLGIKELFQEYIMKVMSGMNFSSIECKVLNRIIVRNCIEYYGKC